jgi:beta-N-acetylhexosaminidase
MPARAQLRRRRAALAVAALLATGAGIATGASGGEDPRPREDAPRGAAPRGDAPARPAPAPPTTPASAPRDGIELAGSTIVLRYAGTRPPAYVLRALRERRAAGVILFANNLDTPAGLRATTRAVHRASRGLGLVMVDQEGGAVRVVPWAGPPAGQPARTLAGARAVARAAGRELAALGVDVALGPVADAARPGTAFTGRAFAGDVAALTDRTVRGWLDAGVLPTAKHFPGLGAAASNTDFVARTAIPAGRAELERTDLPPFRAAIAAGVPLVMASHASYPALDPDRIASQSRPILTGLLRERLGFEGVVVTDSLEARAVTSRSSTATAAVRSMAAGADLLLTTGPGSYLRVLRALRARQRTDPPFAARIAEAAGRVRALQRDRRRAAGPA